MSLLAMSDQLILIDRSIVALMAYVGMIIEVSANVVEQVGASDELILRGNLGAL